MKNENARKARISKKITSKKTAEEFKSEIAELSTIINALCFKQDSLIKAYEKYYRMYYIKSYGVGEYEILGSSPKNALQNLVERLYTEGEGDILRDKIVYVKLLYSKYSRSEGKRFKVKNSYGISLEIHSGTLDELSKIQG